MGRIRVLEDPVINRIAAGEVVERPASVVKELIENSLDAGARRIEVRVAGGGKRLVRVSDDGEGMDRDDALLALERHATSKLRRADDLSTIATLGFRGEALPSIAAVSRFLLRTASEDGIGAEIEVRGGRIESVRDMGMPRGTTVEVAGLFFNMPARRKFLRSDATESAHVARCLTRYALAHPERHFRLDQDDRRVADMAPVASRRERIAQAFGSELSERLLPLEAQVDGLEVRGYAGRPVDASARRDAQHLFVNGRLVQDRVLSHAIVEAYGNTVPSGRHPAVFLFLRIDAGRVDVNVHPQKTEVRFARPGEVHDFVRDAIVRGLSSAGAVPTYRDLRPASPALDPSGAVLRYLETHDGGASVPDPRPAARPAASAGTLPPPARALEGAKAIAQYRESYILAEDPAGLLLVDQHAAHERVLFERYLAAAEENRVEVQRLLFPQTLDLAPHERLLVEEEAAELARLGFALEPFGGETVRLDAIPAIASGLDPLSLVRELLEEAHRTRSAAAGVGALRRKLVTTAACQAAIKIHHALSRDAMQRLLDDLFLTANPTTCPHGRPILFRLDLDEIERTFRRR